MQIEIQTVQVRVNKANESWTFNPGHIDEDAAARVIQYVWEYGVRQILNDAAASAKTEGEAFGLVQKRFENLLSGTIRASGGRESDPVRAEAIRIASDKVKSALKKAGYKLADIDAKLIRARALELISKDPAITQLAKENVEAKAALSVDVSDILEGFDLGGMPIHEDEPEEEAEVEDEVEETEGA